MHKRNGWTSTAILPINYFSGVPFVLDRRHEDLQAHPGGMIENSPAFQRWDRAWAILRSPLQDKAPDGFAPTGIR